MARIVDSFLGELEQEASTTRRVLERVPGDKLSWRPHPKSMSLGQLALHVASTPGSVAKILENDTYQLQDFNQAEAKTAAEILPALEESLKGARAILSTFDDQKLMSIWKGQKNGKDIMAVPRIGVVRGIMFNHWYHHRGQLTVYLRELSVPVPSIYGPSADENPFV